MSTVRRDAYWRRNGWNMDSSVLFNLLILLTKLTCRNLPCLVVVACLPCVGMSQGCPQNYTSHRPAFSELCAGARSPTSAFESPRRNYSPMLVSVFFYISH
ncbi:hypothetical protein BD626DRAFT_255079 [Schizophyllum amplum]|uniref:Secreted protein n=1 Tax=Schizophyllum amplum TaxID=97359 RepID=A0A550CIM6_9AGAR|nr:hypothetical protein BD626DRAFT_255079 [Auriculariopsis ampla]